MRYRRVALVPYFAGLYRVSYYTPFPSFSFAYEECFFCLVAELVGAAAANRAGAECGGQDHHRHQPGVCGGGPGATYTNDFIELHNLSATPQSLNGFSVQYTGPTGPSYTVIPLPDGEFIAAGGYYLIQLGTSGSIGAALPTSDATGTPNIAPTVGKVLLASTTTAFTSACPTPTTTIIDFVGYGTIANCAEGTAATVGSNNAFSFLRLAASGSATTGCKDTNNNAADFTTGTPLARNSASAFANCVPANNPVPTLTSLSPSSVQPGSAAQPLTVSGTNLLPTSVVTFNGTARPTTYISATQITIQLTAADQTTQGYYPVTVTNPSPAAAPRPQPGLRWPIPRPP